MCFLLCEMTCPSTIHLESPTIVHPSTSLKSLWHLHLFVNVSLISVHHRHPLLHFYSQTFFNLCNVFILAVYVGTFSSQFVLIPCCTTWPMLGECIFAAVSQGGVAGGEKNAAEVLPNDSSNENSHQSAGPNNDSPYPLHTTIMCCPHHSCMLSPISPIQHMPNQAVAAAGLARSCLSLHGHPASNCPYPPNSPLMYSSPMVYNPARRSSSARLQRWNSLDANLTGLSHGHHQHQSPNGYWGNESAWSRPSLLDDSYGSETGLYQGPRGFDRPLRPAFSCQSHHGGMFSPFCRSYEYNIWGQGHAPNSGSLDYVDQSGNPNTTAASQMSMSAQSHSSLALNLNESGTEQLQQHPKK